MHCHRLQLLALSSAFGLIVMALAGAEPARAQDESEGDSIWISRSESGTALSMVLDCAARMTW